MRILHTSDWHLGLCLHGVSLLEEQKQAVAQLGRAVSENHVDAVVIAGDLFDHAVARPEAIALYNEMMTLLCRDCGVSVLIVAGNHDGAARLSACGGLLRQAGLYICGALEEAFTPIEIGDVAFFLLPWFHNEQARALFPDMEIRTAADAMRLICARLQDHLPPNRRSVLVAHCFAAGGQTSESDRSAELGGAGRIPTDVFEGFDYVALGHLHRAQSLGKSTRYSGTPYPYSFTEASQEKSFTLLDTDTMQLAEIPALPEAGRRLRELRGTFEAMCEAANTDPRCDDYLHITLTDTTASGERLARLRETYPNLLLLEGLDPPRADGDDTLTVSELAALTPRALVTRFCEEVGGLTPDEEMHGWFERALAMREEVPQ